MDAVKRECKEEVGIIAKNISHFATAQSGATVTWDLFYFIVDEFEESSE
jgi:8-oxo-dGTP pyrophosphatase MutT (NUDIX family)